MQSLIRNIILCTILIFGFSCSKDKLIIVEGNCDDNVNYVENIQAIISTNCAYSNCHDGAGNAPGNYQSYGGLLPSITSFSFKERAVDVRDMPPAYATGPTSLTQEEIELLNCWVENEYAEN